jgi:hypothetical protein
MPRAEHPAEGVLLDAWGRRNRKHPDRRCPQCGNVFRPHRADSKYCSRKCMWANNGGQNAKPETWWRNSRGYIEGRVTTPEGKKRVKQHRMVAEQAIGRALAPHEDVHHVNGNKTDNRPENLQVISHSEHARLSSEARWLARAAKAEGRTDA